MAWATARAAQLYGIGMSWNYMVGTVMRDAAVVPYTFGSELPGIALIALNATPSNADDYWLDTNNTGLRILPDTRGSGANGRLLLADWQELPNGNGFKWNRAIGTFNSGSVPSQGYTGARALIGVARGALSSMTNFRAFAMTNSINTNGSGPTAEYTNGFDNGSTGSFGCNRFFYNGMNLVSNPVAVDLSFAMPEAAFLNGCKANYEMRNLLCAAAIQHSLVSYKHRWLEKTATGRALTINIRSGTLSTLDPNAANSDPILATFSLYSENFTTPDVNGVVNTTTSPVVTATGTGTAAYAEVIGSYSSTGTTPKLYVPVGTTAADNQVTLLSLSVTSGTSVTLVDCGFKFSLAI